MLVNSLSTASLAGSLDIEPIKADDQLGCLRSFIGFMMTMSGYPACHGYEATSAANKGRARTDKDKNNLIVADSKTLWKSPRSVKLQ